MALEVAIGGEGDLEEGETLGKDLYPLASGEEGREYQMGLLEVGVEASVGVSEVAEEDIEEEARWLWFY